MLKNVFVLTPFVLIADFTRFKINPSVRLPLLIALIHFCGSCFAQFKKLPFLKAFPFVSRKKPFSLTLLCLSFYLYANSPVLMNKFPNSLVLPVLPIPL